MRDTKIEWAHHSFNPWWGCQRVSPGCEHCYAETFSRRLGKTLWGPGSERRAMSEHYWGEPKRWARRAAARGHRERVFCASMADVFEDRPDLVEPRARLFKLILETPELDWMLLTKRPENMLRLGWPSSWPSNVWAGATVEDQRRAEERIPELARVPAIVRFLSCEPLLGSVNLLRVPEFEDAIDWVIVGGESGPGARHMERGWVRSIHEQCDSTGAHFFFKQWGGVDKSASGRELDGRTWSETPNTTTERARWDGWGLGRR